jgi:hypothetical protein
MTPCLREIHRSTYAWLEDIVSWISLTSDSLRYLNIFLAGVMRHGTLNMISLAHNTGRDIAAPAWRHASSWSLVLFAGLREYISRRFSPPALAWVTVHPPPVPLLANDPHPIPSRPCPEFPPQDLIQVHRPRGRVVRGRTALHARGPSPSCLLDPDVGSHMGVFSHSFYYLRSSSTPASLSLGYRTRFLLYSLLHLGCPMVASIHGTLFGLSIISFSRLSRLRTSSSLGCRTHRGRCLLALLSPSGQ